jgi:thiosulfate reductase cytochrome b subunit
VTFADAFEAAGDELVERIGVRIDSWETWRAARWWHTPVAWLLVGVLVIGVVLPYSIYAAAFRRDILIAKRAAKQLINTRDAA